MARLALHTGHSSAGSGGSGGASAVGQPSPAPPPKKTNRSVALAHRLTLETGVHAFARRRRSLLVAAPAGGGRDVLGRGRLLGRRKAPRVAQLVGHKAGEPACALFVSVALVVVVVVVCVCVFFGGGAGGRGDFVGLAELNAGTARQRQGVACLPRNPTRPSSPPPKK